MLDCFCWTLAKSRTFLLIPFKPFNSLFSHVCINAVHNQNLKRVSCSTVLTLAYQSLGVVYGDLSTSPLYVYKTTFSGKLSLHEDDEEIFGVLSFIFWTFTLIALFKYIFIVMSADDNGEGRAFLFIYYLCSFWLLFQISDFELLPPQIAQVLQPCHHYFMVMS